MSACNGGHQKEDKIEQKIADTLVVNAYMQSACAYLSDGELYFYNSDKDEKIKFEEESEYIYNLVFDEEGKTIYYSVECDTLLWLKSADLSQSKISPQSLISWELNKFTAFMFLDISPLYYFEGDVIILHGYGLDSQYYDEMVVYSVLDKKIDSKRIDYDAVLNNIGELTGDEARKYFKTIKKQLYYVHKNAKVCLTDKLNFEKQKKIRDNMVETVETQFEYFRFSSDETKVLIGVLVGYNDWPRGSYCIANLDGSNQMMLEESEISPNISKPLWLKNNLIVFIDYEGNLFLANNDENSIRKIAENVSHYISK